jgi:hypothetical protein
MYPESNAAKWLFHQEKATLNNLRKGTFTLVSFYGKANSFAGRRISVVCLATFKPRQSADILCNDRQKYKEFGISYIEKKSENGGLTEESPDKETRTFSLRNHRLPRDIT